MRVLIITNLFGNNRQGYDLANALRRKGCRVKLIQFSQTTDVGNGNYGIHYIRPHGAFSKLHVLWNVLSIASRSLYGRYERIVCMGAVLLPLAAILKCLHRAKLVYYSLEYCKYGRAARYVIRRFVDRYIDVEDYRREQVFKDLNIEKPFRIVYNMPPYSNVLYNKGGLRLFLKSHFDLSEDKKIVIYAGSYQKYSCLELIIKASLEFDHSVVLVLMMSWGVPKDFSIDPSKVFLVPPQSGDTFYEWISEADGALLPYESESDFNVQHCSPQKLFDCYRVGVPYLASSRPLINKIHAIYPDAGCFCDYTDIKSIADGVNRLIKLKTNSAHEKMISLYSEQFNYTKHEDELYLFICGG